MECALGRLYLCHWSSNTVVPKCRSHQRTQVLCSAAAAPLTQPQRALIQTALHRSRGSQQQGTIAKQHLSLQDAQLRASMLQLQQLVAQTAEKARSKQQQQQHQQQGPHANSSVSYTALIYTTPAAALPDTLKQQQAKDAAPAAADMQQQQQLLQQQILLRQLSQQQQVRHRRLQLQIRSEPAVLMSLIKRCNSWQRLQYLFNNHMQHFNAVHVAAAFTHLAQTHGLIHPHELEQQPDGLKQLMRDLTSAAAACIPDYGARQLANTIWAIGKLGCGSKVPRRLRNSYLNAFMQKLPSAAPQHISNVALAVGNMAWGTSTVWQQSMLQAADSKQQFFKPQELANLLYAMPLLNVHPAPPWLSKWLDSCNSSLYSFNAQELSLLGIALVRMKQQPSVLWLTEYLKAVQLQLDAHSTCGRHSTSSASSTDSSSISSSDSQPGLQQQAQDQQQQQLQQRDSRSQGRTPAGFCAQGLVNVLRVLAVWDVRLESSWQASCVACVRQLMGSCSAQGISTLLWALTRLQVPIGGTLLHQLLQQAQLLLPTASSTDLALIMWSCGTLGVRCRRSSSSMPGSSPAAGGSNNRSGGKPSSIWMRDLVYYSRRQLNCASTKDLGSMLVGAVRMHLQPDARWLQAVAAEAHHHLSSMNSMELSSLLLSLTRLKHKPRAAFMADYCSRSTQLLEHAAAAHSKHMRRSRQRTMRHSSRPPSVWRSAELYSPQSMANTVGAMAMLQYQPPKAWSKAFLATSQLLLPVFAARDFAYCIWALAMLDIQPPQLWLDDFLVQLRHHIPTMASSELSATIWALAKLNHKPGVDWMQRFLDRVAALTQTSIDDEQVGDADSTMSQETENLQSSRLNPAGEATQGLALLQAMASPAHRQPVAAGLAPRTPLQLSTDFSSIILHGLTSWATARLECQGVLSGDHSSNSTAQHVGDYLEEQTSSCSGDLGDVFGNELAVPAATAAT